MSRSFSSALIYATSALTLSSLPALAQSAGQLPAAITEIRRADLERDLYYFASDAMRGRESGTLDEMRASIWIADELRRIGVQPAAPDGSFFQWFDIHRARPSQISSYVRVGGEQLAIFGDIVPAANTQLMITAPTVFVENPLDSTFDIRGKVAVIQMTPPVAAVPTNGTNSFEYRYATSAANTTANRLQRRGAAAIIVVADSIGDIGFAGLAAIRPRGSYNVDGMPWFTAGRGRGAGAGARGSGGGGGGGGGAGAAGARMGAAGQVANSPVLIARKAMLPLLRAGADAELRITSEFFDVPSVNIVGVIKGTDSVLRDEYVLYSSHQDHDGVRYLVDGDSVWAGADDNGSGSVALLAIARAFAKEPPRRSILFVYHGAEERGLLGSRYHATTPVVPIGQIVAVLNAEMIGRNHPDSAALFGIQPPHRNSTELVDMILKANQLTGDFIIDSLWDRPTHPEGFYFRSDHLPYARRNVPAVMFSTVLHPDYHTVRDTPNRINYAKLTRITNWMYVSGWLVANAARRPGVDPGFQLER